MLTAKQFINELISSSGKSQNDNLRFYKGDNKKTKSTGNTFASIFKLAKEFKDLPLSEIEKLLDSDYYEARMGAVSIMDFQARDKNISRDHKKKLFDLYICRHDRIDNWDLVDRSAAYVVGGHLFNGERDILYNLAKSKNVWERRSAIVSTHYFIRENDLNDTFSIAELLVNDKHDLINKAVGSWIREAGKKDEKRLIQFLNRYGSTMPRTTLRYAIEKLSKKQKDTYMNR
jgi:3-methyladenine DNA glycosylase AlkD